MLMSTSVINYLANCEDEDLKLEVINMLETFQFLKGYAQKGHMVQTLKALAFAAILHENQFRDSGLPYIMHPLKVCDTLVFLGIEDDITLAAALLHDVLEDCQDKLKSTTFREEISSEVWDLVKLLTKEKIDKSLPEEVIAEKTAAYFNKIKTDPRAILIKLSDRSHNSESLYVMKSERFAKYIEETKHYIYDLVSYGKIHYPMYSNHYTALKSQIRSLCNVSDVYVRKYTEQIDEFQEEKKVLVDDLKYNIEVLCKALKDNGVTELPVLRDIAANY